MDDDTEQTPWELLGIAYRREYGLLQELGRLTEQNALLRQELAQVAGKACIVCDLLGETAKLRTAGADK